MKKILVWLLAATSVLLLVAVVQALVFAKPGSFLWEYRLVVGLCYLAVTRLAVQAHRHARRGPLEA